MIIRILNTGTNIYVRPQVARVIRVYDSRVPSGILESNFTQKGGILAGTGPSTFAEVSPGTDGQFLQYDSNEASGVKAATPTVAISDANNRLLNGGFGLAQRQPLAATLTTLTENGYGPDDWRVTRENANVQYQRGDATGETGLTSMYYGTLKKITSAGKFMLYQILPGVNSVPLRGKTIVWQLKMKASSAKTIRMAVIELQNAGTIDTFPTIVSAWNVDSTDPTLGTNLAVITGAESKSVTTSWTSFQVSVTVPSNSKNLMVAVWTNADFSAADTLSFAEAGLFMGASALAWTPVTRDPQYPAFKNILINGKMQIKQRPWTSYASITAAGIYVHDVWRWGVSSLGTWTQSEEADAPSGSGFRTSTKFLCTTADASPAAGDSLVFQQRIEGMNLQHVLKGTASAQPLTMSFWVKSNLTGTYVCELIDWDNTRHCSKSFTIDASATWERKEITFPADTTGALDNDNNASMYMSIWLDAGTDFTSGTLATTWAATTTANRAAGVSHLGATINNYIQFTGLQLEIGDKATEFEHLPSTVEMNICRRYYYLHASGANQIIGMAAYVSASQVQAAIQFPVEMRAVPSYVGNSGTSYYVNYWNSTSDVFNSLTISLASQRAAAVYNASEASGTAGYAGDMYTNNASTYVAFSADL